MDTDNYQQNTQIITFLTLTFISLFTVIGIGIDNKQEVIGEGEKMVIVHP